MKRVRFEWVSMKGNFLSKIPIKRSNGTFRCLVGKEIRSMPNKITGKMKVSISLPSNGM